MRRWMLWVPALMVGATIYWTLAFGLGGLSLLELGALGALGDGGCQELAAATIEDETPDSVVVHIQEDEGEPAAPAAVTGQGGTVEVTLVDGEPGKTAF